MAQIFKRFGSLRRAGHAEPSLHPDLELQAPTQVPVQGLSSRSEPSSLPGGEIPLSQLRTSLDSEPSIADDATVVEQLYSSWEEKSSPAIPFESGTIPPEPWSSYAAKAWVDANSHNRPEFERYCLSQFIQSCSIYDADTFHFVEAKCAHTSSLRRFSNYWVAWNHRLTGGSTNKYIGLQAAWLSIKVKPTSEDPRPYDLEHWYEVCGGDLAPECEHVPSVRRRKLDEAEKPVKPPPIAMGRSIEKHAQTSSPIPRPVNNVNANQWAPPILPPVNQFANPVGPSHTRTGRGVCARVFWTLVYIVIWLSMVSATGASVSRVAYYSNMNTHMINYNAALCVLGFIIFVTVQFWRARARTSFWVYLFFGIPAVIMLASNTAQCTKSRYEVNCGIPGGITVVTGLSIASAFMYTWAWKI